MSNHNLYGPKLQVLVITHAQLLSKDGITITNTSIRDSILKNQPSKLIGTEKMQITKRIGRITRQLVDIHFFTCKKTISNPHRIPYYEFTIYTQPHTGENAQ
jgi:hypothetical protein